MVETPVRYHLPGVRSRRFAQTFVHAQRRNTGVFAAPVGCFQEFVLGGGVLARVRSGRRVRLGGGPLVANVVVGKFDWLRSCLRGAGIAGKVPLSISDANL